MSIPRRAAVSSRVAKVNRVAAGSRAATSGRIGSPLDTVNCVLWLRGDLGVTLNGANVSSWGDQSGLANNATQSFAANQQPAYSDNRPIFDGSNDDLEQNAILASADWTVGFRFKLTTIPGAATFYSAFTFRQAATTFSELLFCNSGGYTNVTVRAKADGTNGVGFSPTLDTAAHRLVITYNNGSGSDVGSYTISYDGVSQTVSASSAINRIATDLGSIGARVDSAHAPTFPSSMQNQEIVVYSRALTSPERTTLDTYLKWARP